MQTKYKRKMIRRKCFTPAILEGISKILGHTDEGLTGSQIHKFLLDARIDDIDSSNTKWKRLYNAFANFQNKQNCSNNILNFISLVLSPARYVSNPDEFERMRELVNQQLAFVGYYLKENGQYSVISKASVISDVQIRADNLKKELEKRNAHNEIFKYCKVELLQNNYFHSVFEANKGLFERIRELSGLSTDGNALIEEAFSKNPYLIINDYITESEKNEHKGFCNILKGICSMFRNTTSHEAKIYWEITEQDALEVLGIISYCHRRLDKAQKIRM